VHIESSPSDAAVRVDGKWRGKTPLEISLAPGQHGLSLEHAHALDDEQPLHVADAGASVHVGLWRRKPEVVPLRPVYPGASLVDARFLDDGKVALLVDTSTRSGATGASRELWQLDPATAQLTRVKRPLVNGPGSAVALAPDGGHVAYVTPGSSANLSAGLWPTIGSPSTRPHEARADVAWVAPLDESQPPRRVLEISYITQHNSAGQSERIVDVVWAPGGSRLVAITR
jgi:hypothetical protein